MSAQTIDPSLEAPVLRDDAAASAAPKVSFVSLGCPKALVDSERILTRLRAIDEVSPSVAKGRTRGDAPEIDGSVFVASRRPLRVGEIVTRIERADVYDLHGTAVGF